ncbi:hypothetical protein BEL01nite_57670 [Bradyrhizobium elkanii]|nr:hypothetical protein BEL01nite_57670 [Bradyrhizobium elkanii]
MGARTLRDQIVRGIRSVPDETKPGTSRRARYAKQRPDGDAIWAQYQAIFDKVNKRIADVLESPGC